MVTGVSVVTGKIVGERVTVMAGVVAGMVVAGAWVTAGVVTA